MFTVTGHVPPYAYNAKRPHFDHHSSTVPDGRWSNAWPQREHKISVSSENRAVAESLAEIFGRLFTKTEIRDA